MDIIFLESPALHCASPQDQLKCHLLQKASTPSTASNTHRYAKLPVSSSLQGPHMITFIRHYINQIAFSITTSYTLTQSTIVGQYLLYLSFLQSNQNVNVNLVPKLHQPFFLLSSIHPLNSIMALKYHSQPASRTETVSLKLFKKVDKKNK